MDGAGGGFRSTNRRELGLVSRSLPSRLAPDLSQLPAEINRRDECGNAISEPIDQQSPFN
jgi:hypothetical protein